MTALTLRRATRRRSGSARDSPILHRRHPIPTGQGGAERPLAFRLDAMHLAAPAGIVVDGKMVRHAIVPEQQCALGPGPAEGEVRVADMFVEEVEQRLALFLGHILKP